MFGSSTLQDGQSTRFSLELQGSLTPLSPQTCSQSAENLSQSTDNLLMKRVSADIENLTSADTKSEPSGSDGGAVAGRVSGGSWCFLAAVSGGGESIDSGCGL